MSKFHDEFFRQVAGEDELVMKCVTPRGKYIIVNETSNQLGIKLMPKDGMTTAEFSIEVDKDGKAYAPYPPNHCDPNEDRKILWLRGVGKRVMTKREARHEREVICKNRDFILGYADLVFEIEYTCRIEDFVLINSETEKTIPTLNGTERGYEKIVIEVKPLIKDTSAVLRQIKTYMDTLKLEYGAIVSYSDLPPNLIISLNHENVAYIKMEVD